MLIISQSNQKKIKTSNQLVLWSFRLESKGSKQLEDKVHTTLHHSTFWYYNDKGIYGTFCVTQSTQKYHSAQISIQYWFI